MRSIAIILLLGLFACSKREEAPSATPPAAAGLAAQSAEECTRKCNGEWSRHGIRQQLYCLCRTKDGGKNCEDGRECEGECLLRDARTRTVEQGPPARGYYVGRCSEFVTVIGCVSRISRGAKDVGPIELDEPPPKVCAD